MKKFIVLLVIIVFVQINCTYANENDKQTVEITYIANEGFLIKVNNKQILIDALFGHREFEWCETPDRNTLNSILNNNGIFNDIDLIAATHQHRDHFHAPFVMEHLKNNAKGKFVSCKQSVDILKKDEQFYKIKNQIVEITPDSLSYVDTVINDISVRAYRLMHGPYYIEDSLTGKKVNKHKNIQNIGYLFTINGVKIFHSGDSNENGLTEYEYFRLDQENIDIAILGRGFMWAPDCAGVGILKNHIKADHIILMHMHPDEYGKYFNIAAQLQNDFPSVQIFENKLDTKKYSFQLQNK